MVWCTLRVYIVITLHTGREGSGLACAGDMRGRVRYGVRIREIHLDEQSKGKNIQTAVCELRHQQAAAHHRSHQR